MAGISNPIPKIFLKFQKIKYGKNAKFYGIPVIIKTKDSEINIGDNFTVRSSFLSNLVGLYQRSIVFARNGGKINIGNNVGLSGVTIYARNSIAIGDNTLIGGNTKILDNDFHPVDPDLRLKNSSENMAEKPIVIGDNVFIGCNCLIMKGTKIGSNSTIGAGSVVCGNIPENCVAAGNPAKVIKILKKG
ncbi:MAG: acyltransferase [Lachnospirales bacterium]